MMKARFGPHRLGDQRGRRDGQSRASQLCRLQGRLIGMSKSLAQELASRGITVNCVAPGFIPLGDDRRPQ